MKTSSRSNFFRRTRIPGTYLTLALLVTGAWPAAAQGPGPGGPGGNGRPRPISLTSVPVPQPVGADRYVQSPELLVALGKALFWDMQTGSDGRTACATCHFHAGADHRLQNQLASPPNRAAAVALNKQLAAEDFPFHKLADPNNNRSEVLRDTRQVAGSAGLIRRVFWDVMSADASENGADAGDPAFSISGIQVRQVTGRNTPSVINAVYNVRNFWDGRANSVFTGASPFGDSDTTASVVALRDGELRRETVRVTNASLASQAVGPALNSVEMSYDGRTFPKLGQKLLALTPLGRQQVSPEDSVLGWMANAEGLGLRPEYSYGTLIRAAFRPEYWSSDARLDEAGNPLAPESAAPAFTQMELNFSLFWGLAIQAYEATLVSGDTRFDRFADGDPQALTPLEQQGFQAFTAGGQCLGCHAGAEFTNAAFTTAGRAAANRNDPGTLGFFRTGVSPLADDIGFGGTDGFGIPLFTEGPVARANGAFKSPGLRNVELTGPYFHDGGQATLEQVIDFYARRGDFPEGGNLGPGMNRINLPGNMRPAVVAFLKALTDDRVRYDRAPFDHPSLCVPDGHAETAPGVPALSQSDPRFALSAEDKWTLVPATGRGGHGAPLQTFEELLRGAGRDGSRAHAMNEACVP